MRIALKPYFDEVQSVVMKRIYKKLLKRNRIRPWMREREIKIIVETIRKLNPQNCLEWGSGYSTLFFSALLEKSAKWHSVEHNRDWYETVKEMTQESETIVCDLVEPNRTGWIGDGEYVHFKDYIHYPESLNEAFDFILVDGRARVECVKRAANLVARNGVIVLHDANREHYLSVINLFKHHLLFQDHRVVEGGILLLSHDNDLSKFLDVDHHESVWHTHIQFANLNPRWGI